MPSLDYGCTSVPVLDAIPNTSISLVDTAGAQGVVKGSFVVLPATLHLKNSTHWTFMELCFDASLYAFKRPSLSLQLGW